MHLGASGIHTIAIKRIAGTVHFLGLTVYDGGRSKGIALFDACHFGANILDFYDAGTPAAPQNAKLVRNLALVNPHLLVLNLGLNFPEGTTPSMLATQYANLIDLARTTLPDASIAVCTVYNQATDSTVVRTGYTYGQFKAALMTVFVDKAVPLLQLADSMPNVYDDDGTYYQPDGFHMKDAGDVLAARAVGMFVDPDYAVTPPIAVGASVSSTTATSAPITTQATGSLLMAVQFGVVASPSTLTLTDNKGNTFTAEQDLSYAGTYSCRVWKCENAIGGSGHTFTQGGDPTYGSLSVIEITNSIGVRASNGTVTLSPGPWGTGTATAVAGDISVGLIGYSYSTTDATVSAGTGYTVQTQSTASMRPHTAIATHAETGTSASTSFTPSPAQSNAGGFAFIVTVKTAA